MKGHIILGFIFLFIFVLVFYVISTYNKLVKRRNRVNTQWAQIDVQLVRRADLILNLVEAVKAYTAHEKTIFEKISTERNALNSAISPKEKMAAGDRLFDQLSPLLAVAEAYPDLKAESTFISLQTALKDTEDKIAYARQFYNDTVLLYRDSIQQFPSSVVALLFNFNAEAFYIPDKEKKEDMKISFN